MSCTVSFNTLGCRLNQSETAIIQGTFQKKGYRVVPFSEPADIAVINTCTVTQEGDNDTRHLVYKANRLNSKVRIALIGCQAQIQKEKLTHLPNVRWVVGNARKMDLASLIEELFYTQAPQVITPAIPRETFTLPLPAIDPKHTRANLKIQDGCDFFCSFCEIPYARGRARSRKFEDILLEANSLVRSGYQEVVLTGINIGTFQENGFTLLDAINALEQIHGLRRIRISSIEPTTISKSLVRKMSQKSKLCRYLHIPLQSAADDILCLMRRKYTVKEFSDFICEAAQSVPQVCIGTDIIVGFPQEEDRHFLETEKALQELPIHYFHVFSYSRRHWAQSRKLERPVPKPIIHKRSQILRDLSRQKRESYYRSLLNTTQEVLFENEKNGTWTGLTDNYIRVAVSSNKDLHNKFLPVQLISCRGEIVLGKITGPNFS